MSLLYKLQKRNKYKTRIGCPVSYCREKKGSWWRCYNCGANVCKKHEVFNGKTVPYCAICKPEEFGLDENRICNPDKPNYQENVNRLVRDNGHPSKFIEINGKQIEIDLELIPLIRELNKAGLTTTQCCQAYIQPDTMFGIQYYQRTLRGSGTS